MAPKPMADGKSSGGMPGVPTAKVNTATARMPAIGPSKRFRDPEPIR